MEQLDPSCACHHFLARLHGQDMSAQKCGALAKRLASLGNQVRGELPGVGNDGPNFQFDGDTGSSCALGEARGVIAQNLVCPNVDEKRGQASEISVERGREWIAGIGVTEIVAGRVGNASSMKHGAAVGVGSNGVAGGGKIGPGEKSAAAAGSGTPASRSASMSESERPPPADSPATTMFRGGYPAVRRAR